MTAHQSVATKTPSCQTAPAGVCIQEFALRIQKAESSVPAATAMLERKWIRGGTRFAPKSMMPRKLASRKKAVSTS